MLPELEDNYSGYLDHFNDPNAVKLDNDLVVYMMDMMRWVPSIKPANPDEWSGYGLNYYGPTVVNKTGAGKAARLFRLWPALLAEAPDRLELTGGFEWVEGEPFESSRCAVILVSRDVVVKAINDIAALAEDAVSGRSYVLHLGV